MHRLFFLPLFALPITTAHAEGFNAAHSDTKAIAIADEVMSAMGGRKNRDDTRYINWRFFGFRLHVWDKWTDDLRFEQGQMTVLMNVHSKDSIAAKLEHGYRAWINDSYWLVMPYELKDNGVTLSYRGVEKTEDGRPADFLELTFKEVGVTPQNKYAVWVDQESHLVTQWGFYPKGTGPWSNWQRHGAILLFDELPRSVFEDPALSKFSLSAN